MEGTMETEVQAQRSNCKRKKMYSDTQVSGCLEMTWEISAFVAKQRKINSVD